MPRDDDGPAPSDLLDLLDWHEPRADERCRCGDMPGRCPGPAACPLCEASPEEEREASFTCPSCGEPTEELHEGYCEPCRDQRQAELDQHNAQFRRWQSLTPKQRNAEIRRAASWNT